MLLLVAGLSGCGDDGEGNEPERDGGGDAGANNDAGDAQTGVDAGNDAGNDAGTDAGKDAATDGGSDAGDAGDAGTELGNALDRNGVRTDRRRAELIAPVYCSIVIRCSMEGAFPSQEACVSETLDLYDGLPKTNADALDCVDATLDYAACLGAGSACEATLTQCETVLSERETRCTGGPIILP